MKVELCARGIRIAMLLLALLSVGVCVQASDTNAAQQTEKHRVIVLTDISNEPDDTMSLIRFLTYSNEFDVKGIIATTSCWKMSDPDTPAILRVIDAYEKVYPNLLLHAPDYPSPTYLRSITKTGVYGYCMQAAAEELHNEGIDLILSEADRDDPRPLWVLSWGGSNTLGGAVMKARNTRSEEQVQQFIEKLRGYEIGMQDDGYAYIMRHYPNAFLMTSKDQWKGMSRGHGLFTESHGGNDSVADWNWFQTNVQNNHGALGNLYPNPTVIYEGDTPSFLFLIPNGLNDPEQIDQGSWGGRFQTKREKNVMTDTSWVNSHLSKWRDYEVYTEAADTWSYNGTTWSNNKYAPVFRWREAYQNDFAARMDWCVQPYEQANHPPVANVDGALHRQVWSGQTVTLSAAGSSDPDGDSLRYQWMYYKEAGTWQGELPIQAAQSAVASFVAPTVQQPVDVHVILCVTDGGTPALTRYQRVIVTVMPQSERGYDIQHANYSLSDDGVGVTASILASQPFYPATVMVAAYAEDRLVALTTRQMTAADFADGVATLSMTLATADAERVKVFVWDADSQLQPYANVKEAEKKDDGFGT